MNQTSEMLLKDYKPWHQTVDAEVNHVFVFLEIFAGEGGIQS
jgi:hypothetical protein